MSGPTTVNKQLKRGKLRDLTERASVLSDCASLLRTHIEPPLSTHLQLVNFRADTAVIQCDASVWASKAHFEASKLRDYLNQIQNMYDIKRINVVVRPKSEPQKETPQAKRPPMSKSSSELLVSIAENTLDPNLSRALLQLARHGQRNPQTKPDLR